RREVLPRPAIGLREDHVGMRELFVRRHKLPGVDEPSLAEPVQVRRDNECGEALAETRGDVEGGRRAVAKQADALQRVAQLAELCINQGAGSASVVAAQENVDRG